MKKNTVTQESIYYALTAGHHSKLVSRSRSGQVVVWERNEYGQWLRNGSVQRADWIARCVSFRTNGGGSHFWSWS